VIIEPGKNLFLDMFSTNIDTFVPSLYKRVETRSREVLTIVSATSSPPLRHFRLSNVLERIYRPSCESLYTTDTSHRKQEVFLYEYPFY
jgi:hypothetical protein